MRKEWMRRIAMLCILVLVICMLPACKDEPDDRDEKEETQEPGEATVTAVPSLTLKVEVSPTPEATPTPELTETGEPELKRTSCGNGAFSVLVPDYADLDGATQSYGFWRMTNRFYFEAWYIDKAVDGALYDLDEFKSLYDTYGESVLRELLRANKYTRYGDLSEKTFNGYKAIVGPAATASFTDDEGTTTTDYRRFIVYECPYDIGVVLVAYSIFNRTDETLSESDRELDTLLMSCAESLQQVHTARDIGTVQYKRELSDGSVLKFVALEGDVKEVAETENNKLQIRSSASDNAVVEIQHMEFTDDVKSANDLYASMKRMYESSYDFSPREDEQARVHFTKWEMRSTNPSEKLIKNVACRLDDDGDGLWVIAWTRGMESEDDGAGLMSYVVWSFREIKDDSVTPNPTPTPTPTATPQVTPKEISFSRNTVTYMKQDGAFSVKVPEDATVTDYEGGIVAETDNGYFCVWYVNTLYDGVIYDSVDCADLMTSEEDYIELLTVDTMRGVGDTERSVYNNVRCVSAAADTIEVASESRTFRGSGRYYAYDSTQDAIGVYTILYVLDGVDEADTKTIQEMNDLWSECARSLVQLKPCLMYKYAIKTAETKDGTKIRFAHVVEDLNRIETDEDDDLTIYFNAGIAESITIEHFTPKDGISTPQDYYNEKRKKYSDEKYHFTELSNYAGRMQYQHWTLTYREAGDDYTEQVYMRANDDGTMWLIVLCHYTDWEDDGELLLDDMLWTMHEVK